MKTFRITKSDISRHATYFSHLNYVPISDTDMKDESPVRVDYSKIKTLERAKVGQLGEATVLRGGTKQIYFKKQKILLYVPINLDAWIIA